MTPPDLRYRDLPPVQRLLVSPDGLALTRDHGRDAVRDALRAVLADARAELAGATSATAAPSARAIVARAASRLTERARPCLRTVINATGIVLHTNMGRAPLAREAIDAVAAVARGYCNLELDLSDGRRGARAQAVEPLLCELTGAEAAAVVNNGAAAVLLTLAALAADAEVIVSRGEAVEIGGGFRIPDVIRQGGARLVEVGATNKTRIADYRHAITPDTRVLLKVHQSNFRMIGFTAEASIAELAAEAAPRGLAVVADLGSGLLRGTASTAEPTLSDALAAGADVVTCSGDKLLGGPQAGLILGRRSLVERIGRHPLMRAVRLDKMSLAALEATLRLHRDAPLAVPVSAMLAQSPDALRHRAERLRAAVGVGEVAPSRAFAGGGALPETEMASFALLLDPPEGSDAAAARLRAGDPAVIGRIAADRLVIDMLAVPDEAIAALAAALLAGAP